MAAYGIRVTSTSGALTVTVTGPNGGTPHVYSDEALTAAVSLPATVADATSSTFYVASPGTYNLSVKTAGGTEIAAAGNTTRNVDLESAGTIAKYSYDTRLYAAVSGDSGSSTAAAAAASGPRAQTLEVYVDPLIGNDLNAGTAKTQAFQTIQAAYNFLVATAEAAFPPSGGELGVGRINLLPGDHDVGAGFVGKHNRQAEIVGFRTGMNSHHATEAESRIISTSATATELVKVYDSAHPTTGAGTIAHGWTFRDVAFRPNPAVNTALTKILYLIALDNVKISGCSFDTSDATTTLDIYAIYAESRGDCAWYRIIDNNCTRMAFLDCPATPDRTNYNRWIVTQNVCTYSGTLPQMHLEGDVWQCTFADNNMEGTATAFKLEAGVHYNLFSNNNGESSNGTNPFYDLSPASGFIHDNVFVGGRCTATDNSVGTWALVGTNSGANTFIGMCTLAGSAGNKAKITDNSTVGVTLHSTIGGGRVKVKTGTAPTVTDADFRQAPDDGTIALTYGSTGPVYKLWVRLNGTWVSTTLGGAGGSVATDLLWDAKGDLAVATGADTAAKLAVGTDGQVLLADSAQTSGLRWGTPTVTTETLTDAATVTPDSTKNGGALATLSQNTTLANPTGTPVNAQKYLLRVKSTVARTWTYGTQYRGGVDVPLPATTSGGSVTDYYGFAWNSADSKWDLIAVAKGY